MDLILNRVFARIVKKGSLIVVSAQGTRLAFGDGSSDLVVVRLLDRGAEAALLLDPDMRLGELYMDGRLIVEHGSIYEFLSLILREAENTTHSLPARLVDQARSWIRVLRHRNLPARSKRNVAHHYDLDGRLYDLFLDEDRQYSCAYFESPQQSLDDAQRAKKRHIIAKLEMRPGASLLDIGSGWGGMACALAEAGAGRVLGVTLSEEQLAYARERPGLAQAGVEFALADYRSIAGRFDGIVSVGMFEHVGRASYETFFRKCRSLLAENGVMLLHTIGCIAGPGFTTPWLDKYIFPGGYIPSLSEIIPAVEKAGLMVNDIEVLREHYAMTLSHWRRRFKARRAEAASIYDERFCRMWEYYLAAAQVAFECEGLVVFQLQLTRRIDRLPVRRDYIADAEQQLARRRAAPTPYPRLVVEVGS